MNESPPASPQFSSPRHRWFHFAFSLRTMFVFMTLIASVLGWLLWQWRIVQERKAVLTEMRRLKGDQYELNNSLERQDIERLTRRPDPRTPYVDYWKYARVPTVRRLMGDETFVHFVVPTELAPEWIERLENAFPETILTMDGPPSNPEYQVRDSLYKPADRRQPNTGTIFKTGLIEK